MNSLHAGPGNDSRTIIGIAATYHRQRGEALRRRLDRKRENSSATTMVKVNTRGTEKMYASLETATKPKPQNISDTRTSTAPINSALTEFRATFNAAPFYWPFAQSKKSAIVPNMIPKFPPAIWPNRG